MRGLLRRIFDLGFYTPAPARPTPIPPGSGGPPVGPEGARPLKFKTPRDLGAEIGCWLLMAAGVFFGQATSFEDGLGFFHRRLRPEALAVAVVLALALYGPFMRRVRKRRPETGFEHVVPAFGFGLFAGLSGKGVAAKTAKFFLSQGAAGMRRPLDTPPSNIFGRPVTRHSLVVVV